jgi:hypothetical protein
MLTEWEFSKVATSSVYTQQKWHNMMDNIVLNTNILRKVKETSIRGNTIEKWCKQRNTETWTRPLKNTLQLLVGRNKQSSISGKRFSRGIIWRHVWTTYLIFKIRTRQIDGEILHQQQCLMVNRHTCQSVNTGREFQTIILRKWWIQQRQRKMMIIQFATMLEWGELNYYQASYIIKLAKCCVVVTMNLKPLFWRTNGANVTAD